MENIDRIVRAMEMEHTPRGQKRCRVDLLADAAVLDASNSALEIYRSREQALVPSPRTGIQFSSSSMNLEELSVLSKEEVAPFLNTKRVKADGIVYISSALFQRSGRSGPVKQWELDISEDGLRNLMKFPVLGECRRIVSPVTIEKQFLDRTSHEFLKDAWKEIAPWFGFSLDRAQARSEGWVVDDFRKFSVEGHPDGNMLDKQVRLSMQQPLLLEARNAFTDTRVEWDDVKGELVRERDALKEELVRAKELVAEAEEREETLRVEKLKAHEEHSRVRAELEAENAKYADELAKLQEENKWKQLKKSLCKRIWLRSDT
ncbi:hypothetical protein R1sor_007575 [Riccia sorocarpa]|uniref:Uncharacterized protein n=1 Tax=Riccia sorocarpa TaxID=122646 RepID=A0ABD3HTE5_9MARC